MRQSRFIFLAFFILGFASLLRGAEPAPSPRPNILFLLTDDQRWDSLGCMGSALAKTPYLDSLARRGTLFRNAFVTTSICCVSRASIFTGQYQSRHGIGDFRTPFSSAALSNIYPVLLRRAGYRTGFIGKFGVGDALPSGEFDYWEGFPGQGVYFAKGGKEHLTRRMGAQALEFLNDCKPDQPFCLSISFKAPHAQDNAPREYPPDAQDESLYARDTFPTPKTASDRYFKQLPESVQKSEGRTRWNRRFATPEMAQQTTKDYYRLIAGVDREVGRILKTLDEKHLATNTIVVLFGDNGMLLGEHGLAGKWLMYEESIRVPLIIADLRNPRAKTRQIDSMVLNIDLAPTFLDYAGVPIPEAEQGHSLRPFAEGVPVKDWRMEWFYEHNYGPKIIPPSEGVRTHRWSYIRYTAANPVVEELYDLDNDPLQERNLADESGQKRMLAQMRERWRALREQVK